MNYSSRCPKCRAYTETLFLKFDPVCEKCGTKLIGYLAPIPSIIWLSSFFIPHTLVVYFEFNKVISTENGVGQIDINVFSESDCILFRFSDTAKGIEEKIQKLIFNEGATFNKEEGTGYGLYHAKAYLQNWKGDIEITRSDLSGTTFELRLIKWKIEDYGINFGPLVAIVEDEERTQKTISNIIKRVSPTTEIITFKEAESFITWITSPDRDFSGLTITMDYDLEGSDYCGLDLIESLGIGESSYLLTDNFDDSSVAMTCDKLNVPLIPKRALKDLTIYNL